MQYQQQMTALGLNLCRKKLLDEREFETIESAARQVAEELASVLQRAIATRGQAVIAVSGGADAAAGVRTPVSFGRRLGPGYGHAYGRTLGSSLRFTK